MAERYYVEFVFVNDMNAYIDCFYSNNGEGYSEEEAKEATKEIATRDNVREAKVKKLTYGAEKYLDYRTQFRMKTLAELEAVYDDFDFMDDSIYWNEEDMPNSIFEQRALTDELYMIEENRSRGIILR